MVNPYAGEVAIRVDGVDRAMKLTLGALAALEDSLGAESLVDLVARFEGGTPKARDVLALIEAGLRGGGWDGLASSCCKLTSTAAWLRPRARPRCC